MRLPARAVRASRARLSRSPRRVWRFLPRTRVGMRRAAAPPARAHRACARGGARVSRSRGRASAHAGRSRTRAAARARARADPARWRPSGTRGRRRRRPRTRAERLRTPLAALSAEPAPDLLVRHPALPLGLHLEQLEPAVDETRAPHEHAAAVDEATRADVRRQGTYAVVQLARGPRPVELTVGGGDLVRVRDAIVALRHERRRVEDLVEQPRSKLCCTREDDAGVIVLADAEPLLRPDGPRVELLHRPMDRDAGLGIAGHDRAFDGSGASPPRQERRVNVQPQIPLEKRLGNQQPVRRDHDGIDVMAVYTDITPEPLRLKDG